ncbi:selenocysteine-specific translation elongation factor [Roseateles aquatilis]|uniref:Selenocysteine-specific elongation factor n=1 Tax=Roseateles aquatilis TaxID=431061 RepID=A0A246JFS9_9BURK|nr:selenocysteine-specific translation elongation factor [Roseateles aquatilis]OWQ91388.1 selenocysteine-specific translation elongation factor [Roseateles aquatilis]
MIVGTAGHIDHGKTTLVKALTGVDTDRLPEEKRRGISIALGYAFLEVAADEGAAEAAPALPSMSAAPTAPIASAASAAPASGAGSAGGDPRLDEPGELRARPASVRIGFVDVPGHERLVHTMLSGATGIDHALLLVAADDGVMPQTREHLALLSLLGIGRGTVVITKCDRVDAATLARRREEIRALIADSGLAGAPLFEVAATTGEGVAALRRHLIDEARALPSRGVDGQGFRLAVDRVFSLAGVGTVCTGTAHAGEVAIGDELVVLPPDPGQTPKRARVRSLHAQNVAATRAVAGQRVAIGLAGLDKDEVARGQWLAAPDVAQWTDRLDARLRLWSAEARPLRGGTAVHIHVGAEQVTGSVAVLGAIDGAEMDSLPPGGEGLVQLVLHRPIGAWAGDRVVLRDASATRALAGGVVLDPQAPARYRRTRQRLSELVALSEPTPTERLGGLLRHAPMGVDVARFTAAQGLTRAARAALLQAGDAKDDVGAVVMDADGPAWVLGASRTRQWEDAALQRLDRHHEEQPEELGPDLARWRRLAAPRLAEPLWRALVQRMAAAGQVVLSGAAAHRPAHGVQLSALDERLAQKVMPQLLASKFEGAWARDLARDTAEPEALMRTTLARLAQRGELFQVVKDLYYPPPTLQALARIARASAGDGDVTAAAFRDRTGLGRKRAIQVLEFFDRVGLLRRVGDAHRLRTDCQLFMDTTP